MTRPGHRLPLRVLFLCAALTGLATEPAGAQPLDLILPTRNDALYADDGPAFYQYTDRRTSRGTSRPWQGGQYGFVRNVRETPYGTVYSRFHEGADIRPVYRDRAGEPLDTVRAIAEGEVVYVTAIAKNSNYGLYVVVEHRWDAAPYYSLYAHLGRVDVQIGQEVRQGEPLGRLGYTGRGINRRRAHLHFEINLLLNLTFQSWYDDTYPADDPNYHGIYNGINLAGIDVPAFYLALREDPALSVPDFLARQAAFFKVTVPNRGMLDLLRRYPWLSPARNAWTLRYGDVDQSPSWVIYFAASGLPLQIEPSEAPVEAPVVTVIEESPIEYRYLTNGFVEGTDGSYGLTENGWQYVDLLTRAYAVPRRRTAW